MAGGAYSDTPIETMTDLGAKQGGVGEGVVILGLVVSSPLYYSVLF
jgi:hypothetical protein